MKKKHRVTKNTREYVQSLAGNGHSPAAIASLMDMSEDRLTILYEKQLIDGVTLKNDAVISKLHDQAASSDKSASAARQRIFWATKRSPAFGESTTVNSHHQLAGPHRCVAYLPDNGRTPNVKLMDMSSNVRIYDPANPPPFLLEHHPKPRPESE